MRAQPVGVLSIELFSKLLNLFWGEHRQRETAGRLSASIQ
jgi:hypothetical protein